MSANGKYSYKLIYVLITAHGTICIQKNNIPDASLCTCGHVESASYLFTLILTKIIDKDNQLFPLSPMLIYTCKYKSLTSITLFNSFRLCIVLNDSHIARDPSGKYLLVFCRLTFSVIV